MNKKSLTETDIRTKFITPAIVGAHRQKWNVAPRITAVGSPTALMSFAVQEIRGIALRAFPLSWAAPIVSCSSIAPRGGK